MSPENLKWKNSKKWAALPALAAAAVLFSAFFSGGSSNAPQTIYRENTVTRGDIVVGVNETATASIKSHALSFEVSGTIEQVFVKPGQKVQKGDVLAGISTSGILEQLGDAKAEYQEALYELSEAQLAKQKGEIDAYNTYQSTLLAAQFADDTYEVTINKLNQAITTAKNNLYEAQTEVRTLNRLLKYVKEYDDATMRLDDVTSWYEYAQYFYKERKAALDSYIQKQKSKNPAWSPDNDETIGDGEYEQLYTWLKEAEEDLASSKLEYEDTAESYDERYDREYSSESDIKKARTEAYERMTQYENSLKEAEYNLSMQSIQAAQTKENNSKRAEMADTTYEMELRKLENNIISKQQLVDNRLEQVNKYNTYLANSMIISPCNGTVTAVNYSEGAEFAANSTLITVSDSENVYVYMSVTQDDVINIELGQSCTVRLDAFETITFAAAVDSITTSPMRSSSGSASYSVSIRLEGDTKQVYDGMTGSATIVTRQQMDVLQVSYRSVYRGSDGKSYVKVKDADGNLVETPVETGFSDGRNVEIVSGVNEGDIVIIESQVSGL